MSTVYENHTYLLNNPTWHEEDSAWKASKIRSMLDRNGIQASSVCEIGCGAGEILVELSLSMPRHVDFSGYEISPDAFSICSKKAGSNLKFYLRDLLAETQAFFDVLLCIDVLEHVEDFYAFLRKLRGKATWKLFHIPLDLSVQNIIRVQPLDRERKRSGHIHFFTKETAVAALEHSGYEILDTFFTLGSVELPPKSWKASLMKLPRKILFSLSHDLCARYLGGCSLMVLTR